MKDPIRELLDNYETHRIGSHSDDYGGESDKPCFCDLTPKLTTIIEMARGEGFDMALTIWEKTTNATPTELRATIAEGKKYLAELNSIKDGGEL